MGRMWEREGRERQKKEWRVFVSNFLFIDSCLSKNKYNFFDTILERIKLCLMVSIVHNWSYVTYVTDLLEYSCVQPISNHVHFNEQFKLACTY